MKKIWKFVIGGIESKIFNLVLVTFLTVAGVYMSVIWYQSYQLSELVNQTNDKQQESMTNISKETMNSVMDKSLQRFNTLHAERFDDIFATLSSHVELVSQYATAILSDPEAYEMVPVAEPSLNNDGYVIAQLLYADGVNKNDPAVKRKAGLIGNMATMMETLFDSYYNLNSCFIGTPEGVTLNVDERSAEKIGEDGKPVTFPCTERSWYLKAVNTGHICFTDIEKDMFSDRIGIVCCMPVIIDGEVAAVVGADLFLDNLQESISSTVTSGGFAFIINESGHVIMTADTNGAFLVQTADVAEDLRKSRNQQLALFISSAMEGKTDVSVVRVGNETYYMCGAKLKNTGWTIISCMNKEVIDTPSKLMYYEYQKINKEAEASYAENINSSRLTMVVLLIAIFLVGLANALVLSRRIVRPLTRMTKEIGTLGNSSQTFKMKQAYETGDEIQVLAESFEDLSRKTVDYIEQVKRVTAENERMGAEMNLAKNIQESQLPGVFPAYPDRKDFDIFASMDPAKEVGGDFYDFFLIDDDHLALVIADVSGKGVPAALFMMISKSLIKNRLLDNDPPAEALSNVNNHLIEGNNMDMFVTVWCAVIDLKTGKGISANAGHEHPALRRANGLYELVKYKHSPALAMIEDIPFRQREFTMEPGDTLFVYTDGVPEAANTKKEQFTGDRVIESLNKNPDAEPMEVIYGLANDISEFTYGADQFDDITMLCFRYNGPQTNNDEDDRIA